MMCFGVFLFGSIFFGNLWASWTCMSVSFTRLGKFSFIIFSNKFSISCYSSSLPGTPIIRMLEHLKLSSRFLSLSSFLVSSFCSGQMFISSFCSRSLIRILVSFPSLWVHCIFFFILLCIAFISSFILWLNSIISVSNLITNVLNSASDSSLSSCHLVLFLEFWSVLSFGPYFFVSAYLLHCKGRSLRYSPGWGNLLCCM